MENLNGQKRELRKEIRLRKKMFSKEELNHRSESITTRVLNHDMVKKANTVFLYYSMPDEVDTHKLVKQLHAQGKIVLLPKVIDESHLELIPFNGEDKLIESGPYKILEPVGKSFKNYDTIDIAIVPGVAFDKQGNRLGHGKAYYDRELKLMPKAYKIGICFAFQILENIPIDVHDIPMNCILHDEI
jgi:5-formyltetrahydrofolate cyclo-ligase